MNKNATVIYFEAKLLRPANIGPEPPWAFIVLPSSASAKLPRRGRTSIKGTINGCEFRATLEPDGQLSHWLRVSGELIEEAGLSYGGTVKMNISPVEEPEPQVPADLLEALTAAPEALAVWSETTTIARVDWIHWITSAKQSKTRAQRISKACEMLAAGKRRVCCFDSSGFYSKAFSAPKAAE